MPPLDRFIAQIPGQVIGLSMEMICSLYRIFAARAPQQHSKELQDVQNHMRINPGLGRTATQQFAYQICAVGASVVMAASAGFLSGKTTVRDDGWI